MDNDCEEVEDNNSIAEEKPSPEQVTPYISINALEWVASYIHFSSGGLSAPNFIDSKIASKL